MKKIGLVGGTSWTSTIDYYRLINEAVNKKMGGLNYAECIIYSVNFNLFRQCNAAYDWEGTFKLLSGAALQLKAAGADLIMLGANTAHIVAERISESTGLPLVDIRVAVAEAVRQKGIRKVGLIGTAYTMALDFYKNKLEAYGLEVITPKSKTDLALIENTLVHELGKGITSEETKKEYLRIIDGLAQEGAEGIILGCTEIPLLITQEDLTIPAFNSTEIHVQAAVASALSSEHYE